MNIPFKKNGIIMTMNNLILVCMTIKNIEIIIQDDCSLDKVSFYLLIIVKKTIMMVIVV